MLFRNREGKSKHKVCLIMRRGTTNEQKWNIVVKLEKNIQGKQTENKKEVVLKVH